MLIDHDDDDVNVHMFVNKFVPISVEHVYLVFVDEPYLHLRKGDEDVMPIEMDLIMPIVSCWVILIHSG